MTNATPSQRSALLRFALLRTHADTGVEEGIFAAAHELRDSSATSAADRQLLDDLLKWFDENLSSPTRFNRTKSKGHYRRAAKGVSWLKPTAVEHIAQMRALKVILDDNGHHVSEVTTRRPGYVVYEDEHQVVAEPFTKRTR
jgi:hypothetical protein